MTSQCPTCGCPSAASPCPQCSGADSQSSALSTDIGITPPPPGVPPLPRSRRDSGSRPGLPRLPGYEVLERLGERGPATIYKARQTGLRRLVAVELRRDFAGNADLKNNFRHESQTLARLGHPNLAQVFDIGECEGGFYFTREFAEATLTSAGPLTPARLAEMIEQAARAAQAAHERGVVHGRIEAADVLLTEAGVVRLAGFGQRRLAGEEEGTIGGDVRDLGRLLDGFGVLPPALAEARRKSETGEYGSARDLADDLRRARLGEAASPRPPRRRWPALAALAAPLAVALTAWGLWHHSARASLPIDLARADVWVCARGGGLEGGPRVSSKSTEWLARQGVRGIRVCLSGRATWREGDCRVPVLVLSGELDVLPESSRGRLVAGGVIVCSADRARLGLARDDARPAVGPTSVRVLDALPFPASPLGPLVFCDEGTARQALAVPEGEFSFLLGESDDADAAVRAIRRDNHDVTAYTRDELSRAVRLRWLRESAVGRAWAVVSLAILAAAAAIAFRSLRRRARPAAEG